MKIYGSKIEPDRRFSGIVNLYGEPGAIAIGQAHVTVVGLGGVGSWVAEALVRSGVKHLTLIDMDHVNESNINRQLPALESTLGKAKVLVLQERIADIHPTCKVNAIEEFIQYDNLDGLISPESHWVFDCIDNFRLKAALIAFCRGRQQNIIAIGGTGGQYDPTRIQISDLHKTEQDALLARTRRLLRKNYAYPKNPKTKFDVPAVWSNEPVKRSVACEQEAESLSCSGYGSCMPVTASFGMAAVAHVLCHMAGIKMR
jgi:tRNA A37 threonylcarbamoyladenosine dehydratase